MLEIIGVSRLTLRIIGIKALFLHFLLPLDLVLLEDVLESAAHHVLGEAHLFQLSLVLLSFLFVLLQEAVPDLCLSL